MRAPSPCLSMVTISMRVLFLPVETDVCDRRKPKLSDITLTARVYFVGPVIPGAEDATTFYFPCVAYREFEEEEEIVYDLTDCWFIAHEGFSKEDLDRL